MVAILVMNEPVRMPEFSGVKAEYSGGGGRLVFVFHYKRERGREGGSGVQDGCPLAPVTLWMMCIECCLVQLSTLNSKSSF